MSPVAALINSIQGPDAGTFGNPFSIQDLIYNPANDEFTLIWNSRPNATYGVYWTNDLGIGFDFDITDSVIGEADSDTTSFGPFENPFPGADRLYFRIEEIPGN